MSGQRIMIVEDDAIIAEKIKLSLEDMGYEIASMVNNGEKAIDQAFRYHPDLILMDIRLKGEMDGIEAIEIIQSQKDIPVIFMSAYSDAKKVKRAKQTQPHGYIIKPCVLIHL